ncbi:hypothetical protein Acr_08g0011960 [Actinidia rufa]|uniref:Uncharacterized protein n=1 Tax=Actinidia rufa TaxID=165716 RepID=A0A7J0F2B1_9ERIC|nr:hypothetical protein Acr_08g0011960 [Actinidia rufa]
MSMGYGECLGVVGMVVAGLGSRCGGRDGCWGGRVGLWGILTGEADASMAVSSGGESRREKMFKVKAKIRATWKATVILGDNDGLILQTNNKIYIGDERIQM